jgi:hypothetical protein
MARSVQRHVELAPQYDLGTGSGRASALNPFNLGSAASLRLDRQKHANKANVARRLDIDEAVVTFPGMPMPSLQPSNMLDRHCKAFIKGPHLQNRPQTVMTLASLSSTLAGLESHPPAFAPPHLSPQALRRSALDARRPSMSSSHSLSPRNSPHAHRPPSVAPGEHTPHTPSPAFVAAFSQRSPRMVAPEDAGVGNLVNGSARDGALPFHGKHSVPFPRRTHSLALPSHIALTHGPPRRTHSALPPLLPF